MRQIEQISQNRTQIATLIERACTPCVKDMQTLVEQLKTALRGKNPDWIIPEEILVRIRAAAEHMRENQLALAELANIKNPADFGIAPDDVSEARKTWKDAHDSLRGLDAETSEVIAALRPLDNDYARRTIANLEKFRSALACVPGVAEDSG
jgi:hypothetical protein